MTDKMSPEEAVKQVKDLAELLYRLGWEYDAQALQLLIGITERARDERKIKKISDEWWGFDGELLKLFRYILTGDER